MTTLTTLKSEMIRNKKIEQPPDGFTFWLLKTHSKSFEFDSLMVK
jgi:hypothetical protein